MFTKRTKELSQASIARRVARVQGIPPAPLTFSSNRVMANQVGTFYNLPCAIDELPDAQDSEGNFYETPGWSEEGGGDITRTTADTTGTTTDSYGTVDQA